MAVFITTVYTRKDRVREAKGFAQSHTAAKGWAPVLSSPLDCGPRPQLIFLLAHSPHPFSAGHPPPTPQGQAHAHRASAPQEIKEPDLNSATPVPGNRRASQELQQHLGEGQLTGGTEENGGGPHRRGTSELIPRWVRLDCCYYGPHQPLCSTPPRTERRRGWEMQGEGGHRARGGQAASPWQLLGHT